MRALLVSPYPHTRWLSMERYSDRLVLGASGITFSQAYASFFRPPAAFRWVLPTYRARPALQRNQAKGSDLVHITDHSLARHIPLFSDWPVVTTCHDLIPLVFHSHLSLEGRARRLLYFRSIAALGHAESVIAVSEATKRSMVQLLGTNPARVSVVPVAIPHDFAPIEGANERLVCAGIVLPARPRVLSIGHVGWSKNLNLLLEALASPELAGAVLVRVGQRFGNALRKEVTRLGLANRVLELGHVPHEVLLALYSACHVLAQPSWLEGFGIPVAEAQACGLPVVCSDGGSLPEVGGGAARIVPLAGHPGEQQEPGTVARFSAALAEVIENRQLSATMRALGFDHVRQFRPESVAPRLAAAYASTAERWTERPGGIRR